MAEPLGAPGPRRLAWVCLLLAAATLLAYWPLRFNGFIEFDDPEYVSNNAQVQQGLTWGGLVWAFSASHATNWHPLTWLSHMLDVQLFGLVPAAHHAVNLGFHLANTLLLFLLFQRMTGEFWRSAALGGLFALHPLHVESVAWVAERKDVLSAFFGLLSLWAYVEYTRSQGSAEARAASGKNPKTATPAVKLEQPGHSTRPWTWYMLALFGYALALLSKPMLVTWPFVLLLLDYWPLRRPQSCSWKRLVWEKVPFLALSAAVSVITLLVQQQAMLYHKHLSFAARAANAVYACARYLGKVFWPQDLVVLYPHPGHWPPYSILGGLVVVVSVSVLAVVLSRSRPYFLVGWCWFLGMLVPVLGLVQVGVQSMADRYTYLPLIGLFLLIVWSLAEWSQKSSLAVRTLPTLTALVLLALAGRTWSQVRLWRDTETLFTHATAVTRDNWVAHYKLALLALDRYQATRRSGVADQRLGEAVTGSDQRSAGQRDYLAEVIAQCQAALEVEPGLIEVHLTFAKALTEAGRLEEARRHLERAVQLEPHNAEARQNLAEILYRQGEVAGAISEYQATLRDKPDWEPILNNLAWLLATNPDARVRDGVEAVGLAQRACQLTRYTNVWFVQTLAAAYAEAGDFTNAISRAQEACRLAALSQQAEVSNSATARLALYRAGQALRVP